MRQLGQLQSILPSLTEIGFQLIAVSADKPADAKKTIEQRGFTFPLLSDHTMAGSKAFGLAWENPRNKRVLPVPAVFILNRQGEIQFLYVNPDHRMRLDSRVLEAAARALVE